MNRYAPQHHFSQINGLLLDHLQPNENPKSLIVTVREMDMSMLSLRFRP